MVTIARITYQTLTSPPRPMKASDISPAVIKPMAEPLSGTGTSATLMRSRIAANSINTSEKPSAAPKPYITDSKKLFCSCTLIRATPSTAQLVVISGSYGDYEGDGAQVLEIQWRQDPAIDQVAQHRRQREYEGGGGAHSDGRFDLA